MNTLRTYAFTLLTVLRGNQEGVNGNSPHLGWALCRETPQTRSKLAADQLLSTLLGHSPCPEAVAQQFMTELAQCENSAVINLVHSLNDRSVDPVNWANAVNEGLRQDGDILPLTNLARLYLNDLVIPFAAGRITPADSRPHALGFMLGNSSLLDSATVCCDQAALKELVFRRDGPRCVITGYAFVGNGRVPSYCAHIIPFSVYDKTSVHAAIGKFTGHEVKTEGVQSIVNHPANAINMDYGPYVSMCRDLAWGIEARPVNNDWKYYIRVVRPNKIPSIMQLKDGDEIEFGEGDDVSGDTMIIAPPDPRLCNLHLAVARVIVDSGLWKTGTGVVDNYVEQ